MAIKNYSSKQRPNVTVGEIQALLADHGADKVMISYENKEPSAIAFQIEINGRMVPFRLSINAQGMLSVLKRGRGVARQYQTIEQAKRTAWKCVYDWVAAQVAMLEAAQSDAAQLFLGYAILPDGKTVYESVDDIGFKKNSIDEKTKTIN